VFYGGLLVFVQNANSQTFARPKESLNCFLGIFAEVPRERESKKFSEIRLRVAVIALFGEFV